MENFVNLLQKIDKILEKDNRYKEEAYTFVLSALNHTVGQLLNPRHVSAKELLEGASEYALSQFGPMAKTVLSYWGIKNSKDFGNIVFNMISAKLLGKSENDDIKDFENALDFDKVFSFNSDYSLNE